MTAGGGSTLGEQAASNATPAKGMISMKRRRVETADMVNSLKKMVIKNYLNPRMMGQHRMCRLCANTQRAVTFL
jgi:hypothetical protein